LVWQKNDKGRIFVHFNGLSDHTFAIYCDQRQLHWFQRFLEDQETKRASKKQHSSGLFTLRSARLAWQEGEGKGNPWDIHRLTLFCTLDTRLWTAEGTEQVRQEKAVEVAKKITQMQSKGDLLENQQNYIKRLNSTLTRINTPFDRPSNPLYRGQTNIIVGLSVGLEKPATVSIWNATTNQVLGEFSIRQLLGENYRLLNKRRLEQQRTAHQRHKAQKRANSKQPGESELGQYIDRLLAKSIVAIAKRYNAGSIVVPKLSNIREILEAEIQSKAEQKCPGYLEGQKRYAKQYRQQFHRWSYRRLIDNIRSQAAKLGIFIEETRQPLSKRSEDGAKAMAIAAYQARC
jgi:IS605 OrfB family transposase